MSLASFIPEIWSARLLANLRNSLVYASPRVTNRDYEGEISFAGDTVRISSIGTVTIADYTRDTNMNAAQVLADGQQVLYIDQAKYFNFQIDSVDRRQQNPKLMEAAMEEAAYALRNTQDTYMATVGTACAIASQMATTAAPLTITAGTTTGSLVGAGSGTCNAYDVLVALGVRLDNNNVPVQGRYIVVPPWYHAMLLRDNRFVSFGTDPNREVLINGAVGRAAGFDILKSNNVVNSSGTAHKIQAGHPFAITLAEQLLEFTPYVPELRFAAAVKGLMVYGGTVIRPTGLAIAVCNEGT